MGTAHQNPFNAFHLLLVGSAHPTNMSKKRRLRWFQFSLRTLLLLTLVLAVLLATWKTSVQPYVAQKRAADKLAKIGAEIELAPGEPSWMRSLLGEAYTMDVVMVRLEGKEFADRDLAPLADLPQLQRLFLDYVPITDEGLKQIEHLTNLREISLGKTRVGDAGLAHLAKLRNLQSLDLSGNAITDRGVAHLRGLDKLVTLELSKNRITGVGLAHLLKLKAIEKLWLNNNRISDAAFENLDIETHCQEVHLDGNKMTLQAFVAHQGRHIIQLSFGEEGTPFLSIETCLVFTETRHGTCWWRMTDDPRSSAGTITNFSFAPWKDAPKLRGLEIRSMNPMWQKKMKHVGRYTELEHLIFESRGIDDTIMESVGRLKKLRYLSLIGEGITDDNLIHVSGLTRLERLDLSSTSVSDEGLVHLGNLERLEKLYLCFSPITGPGFAHLKGLDRLHAISIFGSHVTDDAVEPLLALKGLRSVDCNGTKMTDEGLDRLRKKPELTVDHGREIKGWQ